MQYLEMHGPGGQTGVDDSPSFLRGSTISDDERPKAVDSSRVERDLTQPQSVLWQVRHHWLRRSSPPPLAGNAGLLVTPDSFSPVQYPESSPQLRKDSLASSMLHFAVVVLNHQLGDSVLGGQYYGMLSIKV